VYAIGEPFPDNIQNIRMGASMNAVVDMIKGSGSHEVLPNPQGHRPILEWRLPDNPNYKKLSFRFTEKDRLYLIRFDLKEISQRDLRTLKKPLFKKYGISWDDPWKLKMKDDDILLYGPPEVGTVYYFEFTNTKTAEKAMELMHRVISTEDRPSRQQEVKPSEGEKKPEAAKEVAPSGAQSTPTATRSPDTISPSSKQESEAPVK